MMFIKVLDALLQGSLSILVLIVHCLKYLKNREQMRLKLLPLV